MASFRLRTANELGFGNPITRPYGDGSETNAGVVAIGEMWGTHCEKIFSNRHYGNGNILLRSGGTFISRLQGEWTNGNGFNANLNALENFNPNLLGDVHRWIPGGLPYNLIDDRNDNIFFGPVIDEVNGYTTQQTFNALQPDVRTIQNYRVRLVAQSGGNINLNALFAEYGY